VSDTLRILAIFLLVLGNAVFVAAEYALVTATPDELAAARVRAGGAEPIVVGVRGTCPEGVCVRNGACLDVVFVKTTDERFAP
jgi:hypothetical protein